MVLNAPSVAREGASDQLYDWLIALPVKVDAGVRSGVDLTGGTVTITGDPVSDAAPAADVDGRDNTDTFVAYVESGSTASASGGQGGGQGNGSGSGEDDGGLPITGPPAIASATVGAVFLVLRVIMVTGTRRRSR